MTIIAYLVDNSLVQSIVTFIAAIIALWSIWYTQKRFDLRQKRDHDSSDLTENKKVQREKYESIYTELSNFKYLLLKSANELEAVMFHTPGGDSIGDSHIYEQAENRFLELMERIDDGLEHIHKASMLIELYFPDLSGFRTEFDKYMQRYEGFLEEYRLEEADLLSDFSIFEEWRKIAKRIDIWQRKVVLSVNDANL